MNVGENGMGFLIHEKLQRGSKRPEGLDTLSRGSGPKKLEFWIALRMLNLGKAKWIDIKILHLHVRVNKLQQFFLYKRYCVELQVLSCSC